MLLGRRCIGFGLAALGVGLLLSELFEGALIRLLLGLILAGVGFAVMKCC